jgi:hypothetical protein
MSEKVSFKTLKPTVPADNQSLLDGIILFYAFDPLTLSHQPIVIGFGRRGKRARFFPL